MRALFTVFRKEFLENLRDRRTLVSALLFGPLFGPLLFGAMVSRMLDQSVVESDEPLQITISGGERAPNLLRYLESQGVKLSAAALSEDAARAAVRSGASTVVLIVPPEYAARFAAARPAPLLLVADSSDSQTRKSAERLRALLAGYGSGIAQLRLQVRGVSPLLAVPIAVNEIDVDDTGRPRRGGAGLHDVFRAVRSVDGGAVPGHRFDRGRARTRLARGPAQPAGGARIAGGRQDSRDLRLHVPVAGHQSRRIRRRVPLRAARAARHERQSRHGNRARSSSPSACRSCLWAPR